MLKNLRDLLGVVAGYCRLEAAIVDELEEQHSDIYALKENRKLDNASIRALNDRVTKLEMQLRGKVTV